MKDILKLALQILIIGCVLLGLVFGGIALYKQSFQPSLKGISQQYETTKYAVATTSVLALATSTDDTKWIIPISLGVDQLNLNLRMTASSTSGQLDWSYEWSEDRIDWFSEDIASTTASMVTQYVDHSATTTAKHRWLPASTSEVAKSVVIPNVNANFLRINFERGAVYENLILWAEVRSHTN